MREKRERERETNGTQGPLLATSVIMAGDTLCILNLKTDFNYTLEQSRSFGRTSLFPS